MNIIEPFHPNVRIGDFVGLMIFANYLKVIENHQSLIFNLETTNKHIDESLNIPIIFKDLISSFVNHEDQIRMISGIQRRGSGCIWITVPALYAKYGSQILPYLNLPDSLYTGPMIDWDNYICFSPLFNGSYNQSRGMDIIFCNDLIDSLYLKYLDKFIVITDQPNKIRNKNIKCIVDSNLYNLVYIISKCKIFIGGDTGFTHFAGLCRPRGLISIYEQDQFRNFNSLRNNELYPLSYWNSDPVIDRSKTVHLHLNMINHSLPNFDKIHQLIKLINEEK